MVLVGEERLVCGLFCVYNVSSTFWFSLSKLFFPFFSVMFLPLVSSFGVCSTHVNVLLVESLLRFSGNSFLLERILGLIGRLVSLGVAEGLAACFGLWTTSLLVWVVCFCEGVLVSFAVGVFPGLVLS